MYDWCMYRIVVVTKAGAEIGEFINFTKLSFTKRLNNYGTCTFEIPIEEPNLDSLISLRNYEVRIYRYDTLVWAGEQTHLTANIDRKSIEPMTITCQSYLELFNNRFTDIEDIYTGVDAGAIAWNLINDSQLLTDGDFGITEGYIASTTDRDRTYNNKNIMDVIIELSNVAGGFDFEITDEKVFNVYSRKGNDRSNEIVFEYGTNMDNINIELDFTNPINQGIALGEGIGNLQLMQTYTNTSARSVNKLRQGKIEDPSVIELPTLLSKATELVRVNKQSISNLSFNQVQGTIPLFGTLVLGDLVRVIVNRSIFNINYIYRIYALSVKLNTKGEETVQYLVSLII